MTASRNSHIDVLIVGAGPTGLTMACELARQPAMLVDLGKREEDSTDAVLEQAIVVGDDSDGGRVQSAPVEMVVAAGQIGRLEQAQMPP